MLSPTSKANYNSAKSLVFKLQFHLINYLKKLTNYFWKKYLKGSKLSPAYQFTVIGYV